MSKVLKANRSFISTRSGFKRLGDILPASDPEYARLLRFATKQKSDGVADPVWIIVDEQKVAPKEEAPKEEAPKEEAPKAPEENSESAPAQKKSKDSK